jgi:putative restriction endonuclease
MPSKDARWTREQLIAALDLYCRTPFGRLHRSNPDVVTLGKAIGRTPSAVAMKLVNFASF